MKQDLADMHPEIRYIVTDCAKCGLFEIGDIIIRSRSFVDIHDALYRTLEFLYDSIYVFDKGYVEAKDWKRVKRISYVLDREFYKGRIDTLKKEISFYENLLEKES